jgi:hypothetical protein
MVNQGLPLTLRGMKRGREQRYREGLVNAGCAVGVAVVLDDLARPATRVGVTDRGTYDRMEAGLDEGRSKLKQVWGDATDNQCS